MKPGNQVTAGGFVLAAGEGQAFWSLDSLTVPNAGSDLRATPSPPGSHRPSGGSRPPPAVTVTARSRLRTRGAPARRCVM